VRHPRPDHLTRRALGALLYFPSRAILQTPADAGLAFDELELSIEDGERLDGWRIAGREPSLGHLLFCHGNAGNIGDRVPNSAPLAAAGFDVLLFDYRGYGRSTGKPDEHGTYRDVHAALAALVRRPSVDRNRVFYLGESLGGAVALALAVERPPRGLILQSTFTSIRDAARAHYPFIPTVLIPDAYPWGALDCAPGRKPPAGPRGSQSAWTGPPRVVVGCSGPEGGGRSLFRIAPRNVQGHPAASSGGRCRGRGAG
jgi:uncharacterized protein